MSVNLCVDWGNTHVKAAIFENDTIKHSATFDGKNAHGRLSEMIDTYRPAKAILCAVVNYDDDIERMIREKVKSFILLGSTTRLPINNAYSSPGTLGYDRVALATAAHILYPDKSNLVIALGTCITYNYVQRNRTFRGGAISPGLQMRLQAMHQFTDRLPEITLDGELLLLGYDTATCMRSGAVFGMTAEIDGMIKEFENQQTDFNAILTGGDAPYFATKIKSKIFADADLLLKGLNIILNYNVPIPR